MAASSRRGGSCARAVRSCCNQFIRLWLLVLNVIDGVAGVLRSYNTFVAVFLALTLIGYMAFVRPGRKLSAT